MSVDIVVPTAVAAGRDDFLTKAGRWVAVKVWTGCVFSAAFVIGDRYGWPEAVLSAAGLVGAVALALAAGWLPIWTKHHHTGLALIDVGARLIMWGGLAACVVALLISYPASGAPAGALLLQAAAKAFGHRFAPPVRRLTYRGRA